MRKLRLSTLVVLLFCAVWLASCGPADISYTYRIPEQTSDGWRTASLDDVGIDEKTLGELTGRIHRGEYENVHSILIVKDGKLVFEEYFDGYTYAWEGDQFWGDFTEFDIDTPHTIMSVTKAFTSALIGIAIDRGYIQDVDEKVFSFFPEYSYLNDGEKDRITLEHLLTMTSGLEWNEWDIPVTMRDTRNDLIQLFFVSDPIEYVLAKPIVAEPGTRWYYSGGDVNVLGEVIRKATGLRMDDFADNYLFGPLGITEYAWDYINPDIVHASGDLKLRPRDMAKFGYLHLNGGVWNGERIISEEWIGNTMKEYIAIPGQIWEGDRYGYQWWLKTYQADSATVDAIIRSGWGGQSLVLFPSLDMMVVFTGGQYVEQDSVDEMVSHFILPAAHSRYP